MLSKILSLFKRKKVIQTCNILVVGDWFVDEYWFLVRHYSDISSHVVPLHYRIASKPREYVKNLCGAGLVAQVLYRLRKYEIINYKDYEKKLKEKFNAPDNVLDKLKK